MDFSKLVEKRASVRKFKDKKVNWRNIVDAIDSARFIPLAGNISNIKFITIENKKTINEIADECGQSWISEVSALTVVCSDETLLEKRFYERGRIYSRQQAGAAIQNFILRLTDLGLSSCWVGSFNDSKVRRILDIPKEITIEAIIPIGYEKTKTAPKRKTALQNVSFWEKWDQQKRGPFFKEPKK